jgi:hypothetical protein
MEGEGPRIRAAEQAVRTPRAAALAGIVFAVLHASSIVLMQLAITGDADDVGEWVDDDGRRRTVLAALNLLPFAGLAFLWLIGVVRDRIGAREDRFFATVFLGSGLLFVAMLFVGGAAASALIDGAARGLDDELRSVWPFGHRLAIDVWTVYAMRMASVFTLSTTTLGLRLGILPRWLALWGVLTSAVLLFAVGAVRWAGLALPLWVLVLSVHLLVTTFRADTAERLTPTG